MSGAAWAGSNCPEPRWVITDPLISSQIQQLMDEKIVIKFIAPDAEIENDMTVSPEVQEEKRRQSIYA